MMDRHLEPNKRDVLAEVFARSLGDRRLEIGSSDAYELRPALKQHVARAAGRS